MELFDILYARKTAGGSGGAKVAFYQPGDPAESVPSEIGNLIKISSEVPTAAELVGGILGIVARDGLVPDPAATAIKKITQDDLAYADGFPGSTMISGLFMVVDAYTAQMVGLTPGIWATEPSGRSIETVLVWQT